MGQIRLSDPTRPVARYLYRPVPMPPYPRVQAYPYFTRAHQLLDSLYACLLNVKLLSGIVNPANLSLSISSYAF